MNTKAKGSRNEHRSVMLLEAAGYACTCAAATLCAFDINQHRQPRRGARRGENT
jgi:hypothetical protein